MGQHPGNGDTGLPRLPTAISDTLVLYHNGHEAHWLGKGADDPLCVRPAVAGDDAPTAVAQCWVNYDTVLGWLNVRPQPAPPVLKPPETLNVQIASPIDSSRRCAFHLNGWGTAWAAGAGIRRDGI